METGCSGGVDRQHLALKIGPNLVDRRADGGAHGRADSSTLGAELLHFRDRCFDDTAYGTAPARMRRRHHAADRIGKQHRRAIGTQRAPTATPGVAVTMASTFGRSPSSQVP